MSRDPRQRLKDAVAAGREAVAMIEGVDAERFAARSVVVRGVERCIFIIGEALTHVDEGAREAHPEVPWREIIGMRNPAPRRTNERRAGDAPCRSCCPP